MLNSSTTDAVDGFQVCSRVIRWVEVCPGSHSCRLLSRLSTLMARGRVALGILVSH